MTNRDGVLVSLWQGTTEKYIPVNRRKKNKTYDVVIAGGGITGLTTALLLQEAGKKCILLEANSLCFGTTGGTTAHLNTVMDTPYPTIISNFGKENARLVPQMAAQVIELIKTNIKKYSISCDFERTAAYLFSQNKKQTQELEGISEACQELGLAVRSVKEIPLPFKFIKALKIGEQAKFHPLHYVFGLAKAFEALGGVIKEQCRVHPVDNTEDIKVNTNHGTYLARDVIYATHIPPGSSIFNYRCAPYRTYAIAVTLSGNFYPQGLVYDMDDPYHYYRTHKIGRKKYLIAGGEDHKTGHEENTNACLLKLESHVLAHLPVKKIEYRWSSQYFEPVDGLPYIGHMPGAPGHIFVATGFGGNGMIYSGASALILKQLVLNEPEDRFIKLFDPNRIKPLAGFTNLIKENADTLKEWLFKWLPAEQLSQFAALAPGEAKVVKVDGKALALHKDEGGQFHAVNPICTHAGCQVSWNAVEMSWDCPCHGSRFSADGQVLNGPADLALEKINLIRED